MGLYQASGLHTGQVPASFSLHGAGWGERKLAEGAHTSSLAWEPEKSNALLTREV